MLILNELNTKIIKYYALKAKELRYLSFEETLKKIPLTCCRMRYKRQTGNGGYIGTAKTFNFFFENKDKIIYESDAIGKNDNDRKDNFQFYNKVYGTLLDVNYTNNDVLRVISEQMGLEANEFMEFVLHPGEDKNKAEPGQDWHLLICFYLYNSMNNKEVCFLDKNIVCRELWFWLVEITKTDIIKSNSDYKDEFSNDAILELSSDISIASNRISKYREIFKCFFEQYR